VETLAGRIVPELEPDGAIRVDMGPPFLAPEAVPTTLALGPAGLPQGVLEVEGELLEVAAAGMGNPHVVIPVADVASVDLERLGAALEVHPAFPARTNVHFVQLLSPTHLVMRVWERGAGPTLACGTGACATLVACHRLGLAAATARVDLPGGSLRIDWQGEGQPVVMTGPAEAVFDGVLVPALLGADAPGAGAGPVSSGAAAAGGVVVEPAVGPAPEQLQVINCSTACAQGCIRPEACASADARARVAALLADRSLDQLVSMASPGGRSTAGPLSEPGG
jgi:diaminopimelate epimerase